MKLSLTMLLSIYYFTNTIYLHAINIFSFFLLCIKKIYDTQRVTDDILLVIS